MKSVLTSIQPYYVFLIIARAMGCKVEHEKTVEVRKNFPCAKDWDKKSLIYCSKNRRSFKRIPKEYQPLMAPLLGKVIGEFVCNKIYEIIPCGDSYSAEYYARGNEKDSDCLTFNELFKYLGDKVGFGWHISELKIYDKPRELSDYYKSSGSCGDCKYLQVDYWDDGFCNKYKQFLDYYDGYISCERCCKITCAPQSWQYVEV